MNSKAGAYYSRHNRQSLSDWDEPQLWTEDENFSSSHQLSLIKFPIKIAPGIQTKTVMKMSL